MQIISTLLALSAPFLVAAAPVRRATEADILVVRFAEVLNQLEATFYQQALETFQNADLEAAGFVSGQAAREQMEVILSNEQTHIETLRATLTTLGSTPIECQYDASSALVDAQTMIATARILEYTGVSAFLGAAPLLTESLLLEAAASILTVEARHSTMLNALNAGTAIPSPFDVPLTPSEILAIASPFISGCDLGVVANPSLALTNAGPLTAGTAMTFSSPALNETVTGAFCQVLTGGQMFATPMPLEACVVPQGVNGPVAIWVTSDSQPLVGNAINRAASQLLAGPTISYVDSIPDALAQFVRPATNGASVTRRIISKEEAEAMMAANGQ